MDFFFFQNLVADHNETLTRIYDKNDHLWLICINFLCKALRNFSHGCQFSWPHLYSSQASKSALYERIKEGKTAVLIKTATTSMMFALRGRGKSTRYSIYGPPGNAAIKIFICFVIKKSKENDLSRYTLCEGPTIFVKKSVHSVTTVEQLNLYHSNLFAFYFLGINAPGITLLCILFYLRFCTQMFSI